MLGSRLSKVIANVVVFVTLASSAWASNGNSCERVLTGFIDSNRIEGAVFYPQSIATPFKSYSEIVDRFQKLAQKSPEKIQEKRVYLKGEAMYRSEPVPVVIRRDVWDMLKASSEQRARAATAFLRDIYSSDRPAIYEKHPELKAIVESSPGFVREVVGQPFVKEVGFDIVLAMDIVIVRNTDGTFAIRTLESDSGNIGGNLRMPSLFQGLTKIWGGSDLTHDFVDTRASVAERMLRHSVRALGRNGFSLMFTEHEEGYSENDKTWIRSEFDDHNVLVTSYWGIPKLEYNEKENIYYYEQNGYKFPITDFWLEHYSQAFDPNVPSFANLPDSKTKDEFMIQHQLPGFWKHYMNGGYKHWAQTNALGSEVFCDKAISAYLPQMVEFYLNESPILQDRPYRSFAQGSKKEIRSFIDHVFKNRAQYVVKSRRDSGQGHGVYVGAFLGDDKTKNGLTWGQVKNLVMRNPVEWIVQDFFKEETIPLIDGRVRAFEIRTITNTFNGKPYTLDAAYIRSSNPGTFRNMSGTKSASADEELLKPSIIPVLIPKK